MTCALSAICKNSVAENSTLCYLHSGRAAQDEWKLKADSRKEAPVIAASKPKCNQKGCQRAPRDPRHLFCSHHCPKAKQKRMERQQKRRFNLDVEEEWMKEMSSD